MYSIEYLEQAHKSCSYHKEEILISNLCGCFSFLPLEIVEWFEENIEFGETAVCPKCRIDSVLSSEFPITDKYFLNEMNKHWF